MLFLSTIIAMHPRTNMNKQEKLIYFQENIVQIFNSNDNKSLNFINEFITDHEIQNSINKWPESIKLKLVDKYIESI